MSAPGPPAAPETCSWAATAAKACPAGRATPGDIAFGFGTRGRAPPWSRRLRAQSVSAAAAAPQFSFSRCNYAIALYQGAEDDAAVTKTLQSLTRKYPNFDDPHAALTAILWDAG